MEKIENRLKKVFFTVSIYEDFLSTILGGLVVFMVGFLIFNFLKSKVYRSKITDEAASVVNVEAIKESEYPKKYTVKQGDYLAKISFENYGSEDYWNEIAKENNIINADFLNVGMELELPKIEVVKEGYVAGENNIENLGSILDASSTERERTNKYIVKEGDNLFLIAQKAYGNGEKWIEIYGENKLLNADYIYTGQELIIP